MSQAIADISRARRGRETVRAPALPRAGTGQNRLAYGLFILVNATLFIRPGEIFPATESWPIYLWLIFGCAACSLPMLMKQLRWSYLSRNPGVLCVVLLIPAVFLSHASHGDLWSARFDSIEFAKIVLYFLLLVGLVDSMERLQGFLALTVIFIAVSAVFAILNYHDIFTLSAMKVLDRQNGFDANTGENEIIKQLQATGIFSDPNDFSVILVTAILGAVHFAMEAKDKLRRTGWLLLAPVLIYAFALTKSRGGFLSLMAGVGALLVTRFGWRRALKIGLLLAPFLVVAFAGRQTNIDVSDKSDTAYGRVLLWREGTVMFKGAPIFGHGFGTYAEEARQVAHNSYIHAFAELGFFGGACFLMAFLSPLLSCRKVVFKENGDVAKRMAGTIFAIMLAYAVGIFSLSRNYSNATYLVLGLGCVLCALGNSEQAVWMKFDGRFIKRAAVAGVAMLVFISFVIRVLTLWM